MPPNRKRAHEPHKSDTELISLIDDCFFSIFDQLSLHDLCSIAQTCKRLQQVSSAYFLLRHTSKILIIEKISAAGDLQTMQKEEYIDIFKTSCQKVTLGYQLESTVELQRLAKYYRNNEMVSIKSLRLEGWERGFTVDHGPVLADMVSEVESFTLSNSKIVGDFHDCILQHLPNMNRLKISKKCNIFQWMQSHQWLQHPYPNLRYFSWHTDVEAPTDLVRGFFEINPGIRYFSLQSQSRTTLQNLVKYNINVNELFYSISRELVDPNHPSDFEDLQKLCSLQGIKQSL